MATTGSSAAVPAMGTFPDGTTNFGMGTIYLVVASIITPLMLIFVSLRLYIRFRLQKSPGWDDAACVIATLCHLSYIGLLYYVSTIGLGKNVWEIQPLYVLKIIDLVTVCAILAEPSLLFTKLSLLLLYWRLFSRKNFIRWAIYAGIIFCTLFYTIAMFLFIGAKGQYQIQLGTNNAVAIINPITDFYILALPIVAVLDLHISSRQKLGVIVIFLWGLLACIMSILSAVYRFEYNSEALTNPTRKLVSVFTVNTVEVGIGIMCGCMPLMPALFSKWQSKQRSTGYQSRQTVDSDTRAAETKNMTLRPSKSSWSDHSGSDSNAVFQMRPSEQV